MARKFSWKGYNVKETQVGVRTLRLALYELQENFTLFGKNIGGRKRERERGRSAP